MPSVSAARGTALLTVPLALTVNLLVFAIGLTMYAVYTGCDPLKKGIIQTRDQLVIYYMVDMFHSLPGFSGLFLASLMRPVHMPCGTDCAPCVRACVRVSVRLANACICACVCESREFVYLCVCRANAYICSCVRMYVMVGPDCAPCVSACVCASRECVYLCVCRANAYICAFVCMSRWGWTACNAEG